MAFFGRGETFFFFSLWFGQHNLSIVGPQEHLICFHNFYSYNENDKVFESKNGGSNWTNISGNNLPNLPVNCIVFQSYSKDDLYVGTDIGLYHKDSTMSDWQLYNNGLPFVSVRELEIQYSAGKIRAATFGRGVWESPLNTLSTLNTNNL